MIEWSLSITKKQFAKKLRELVVEGVYHSQDGANENEGVLSSVDNGLVFNYQHDGDKVLTLTAVGIPKFLSNEEIEKVIDAWFRQ